MLLIAYEIISVSAGKDHERRISYIQTLERGIDFVLMSVFGSVEVFGQVSGVLQALLELMGWVSSAAAGRPVPQRRDTGDSGRTLRMEIPPWCFLPLVYHINQINVMS